MVNTYIQKQFICVEYCQNYILKDVKKIQKGCCSVIFHYLSNSGIGCDISIYENFREATELPFCQVIHLFSLSKIIC